MEIAFNKPNVSQFKYNDKRTRRLLCSSKIAQGNTVEIIEFEVPKADIQMKRQQFHNIRHLRIC
jgi:hypothetical protein